MVCVACVRVCIGFAMRSRRRRQSISSRCVLNAVAFRFLLNLILLFRSFRSVFLVDLCDECAVCRFQLKVLMADRESLDVRHNFHKLDRFQLKFIDFSAMMR